MSASRELHPWRIRDVGDGNTGCVQGRLVGEPPPVRYGLYRDALPQRLRVSGTSRVTSG